MPAPYPWYICIILSSWADVKTDSLFYLLFQLAPPLFFDLIGAPGQGQGYRFESVEVKEAAFRIDGVFLPPEGATDQPVYFVEVQFQRDRQIYRRLFAEIFLFLQKHPQVNHWRSVVIFPRASLEPDDEIAYGLLLNSDHCQRVGCKRIDVRYPVPWTGFPWPYGTACWARGWPIALRVTQAPIDSGLHFA